MDFPVLSSKRLRRIADSIDEEYSIVWDCCCDHGLLGIELLRRGLRQVHFVDCEKSLIDALQIKLEASTLDPARWQVSCADVSQMSIPDDKRQLIIIAGVGGDTCLEMVCALLDRYPQHSLDFILCPVRQLELLRVSLSNYPVGLVRDDLVVERGRYYEVLHLRQNHPRSLGYIAQDFWQSDQVDHKKYLSSRISYLRKLKSADATRLEPALASYRVLLNQYERQE